MYFEIFECIKYLVALIGFYCEMVFFTTYVLSLDDHQLVFNLYLNWVKEGNLFYLFLIDFEIYELKEHIRMVIRWKYKKPIV